MAAPAHAMLFFTSPELVCLYFIGPFIMIENDQTVKTHSDK